jgi:hypothetical protein
MRAAKELEHLDGYYSRCLKLPLLVSALLMSFGCGIFYSRNIPSTLFSHPLTTLRLMQLFPVGTNVAPINTPEARKQFEQFGWGTEPAVVVDYEAVTLQGKEVMLCHVRTHRGTGYILSVNPEWISRPEQSLSEGPELLSARTY